MSDLGKIQRFEQISGPWPFPNLPDTVTFDDSTWNRIPPGGQLADWGFDQDIIGGYREDTAVPEQSRHMLVAREDDGSWNYLIDHRETNPQYDFFAHAKEVIVDFAQRRPVLTTAIVVVAAVGLAHLFRSAGK